MDKTFNVAFQFKNLERFTIFYWSKHQKEQFSFSEIPADLENFVNLPNISANRSQTEKRHNLWILNCHPSQCQLHFWIMLVLCKCQPFQGWMSSKFFSQRDNKIPNLNASIMHNTSMMRAVRANGQITKVKQPIPWLILNWVTTWDACILSFISLAAISRNIRYISQILLMRWNFGKKTQTSYAKKYC